MKLIVGLGNPGSKYEKTRHNIGRMMVEYSSHHYKGSFTSQRKTKAFVSPVTIEGQDVVLAYPDVYMNHSGVVVSMLVNQFDVQCQNDLLVLVDDFAIPFGCFRLRQKGSDGGHNGLKSIETHLQHQNYARLRVGIGRIAKDGHSVDLGEPSEDFVLKAFSKAETSQLEEIIPRGLRALTLWLTQPIGSAMNAVNSSQISS